MYGDCGRKSFFGSPLPCPSNIKAVAPSESETDLLRRICGQDFDTSAVCCSQEQLISMEANLKRVDPLISSCPACRHNFYDFICKFTCSPNQATFINITQTGIATDTKETIVTELTQYIDPKAADDFFQSCKNIKFSATNGYAMDLIGGGAKDFRQFLKFLGDEKPLLGGSPFQINYKFELDEQESEKGFVLRKDDMKPCDDDEYKCACSDCATSCPKLPRFRDFSKSCKIGVLPCFSFSVILVWLVLILLLGAYHVYLAGLKRQKQLHQFDSDDLDGIISPHAFGRRTRDNFVHIVHLKLISSIESQFDTIGHYCSTFPRSTVAICLAFTLLLSSGLKWLTFETDPINLWVSPNEPALKNLHYYEETFGEWFRIEQLIISSKNESEPVLNWENIKWWFEKELELQNLRDDVLYDSLCFKPLGETCAIESFAQYFQGNIGYINENNWKQKLKSCTDSPVNCLPTFQQPLKKNILFDRDDVIDARAFTITLLFNSNLTNSNYTQSAIEYEHLIQDWVFKIKDENPNVNIDFSTEISLTEELNKSTNTDVKIVVISYVFMFIYASLALGGRLPNKNLQSLVKTRFSLAFAGIVSIILSVLSSIGFFSFVGLKSTLIIAEVIPFLVLAIGIDNIFLLVHELHLVNETINDKPVEFRVTLALKRVGPSCLFSAVLQITMFLLATSVDMPAVKNFAYYSAGGILINFILQMTAFVALLALDQKRLEDGRLDIFPWYQVDHQISLEQDDVHVEYNFSRFIRESYVPLLMAKSSRRKVITFFVVWFGVSLSFLPGIQLGLDQRLALPSDSYLVGYFDALYKYLNVGPPVSFIIRDLDVTDRANQQKICGKFSSCDLYSVANILEQEYKRGHKSTITDPATNWLDDFLTWLNPNLDQCCRFKKSSLTPLNRPEFCTPYAPERQCQTCFDNHDPPYDSSMNGFPTGEDFMFYFNQWIEEPSDPCPLGGKAPYSTSISWNTSAVGASLFRAGHKPLRSQNDFIVAYKNSLRIVDEIKKFQDVDVFATSPFYIFFVQYESIVHLTFKLLAIALVIIWGVSTFLLGLVQTAAVLVVTVLSILVNIGGVLSVWSISLNAVSLVNLVICAGLAVEFTIHITRAYTKCSQTIFDCENQEQLYSEFMSSGDEARYITGLTDDVRLAKATYALTTVGGPVLGGITLTKVIGIFVLAFTRSKIFEVYYFRMWLALIVIAAVHALCLLPVLLSIFGDGRVEKRVPEDSGADTNEPEPLQ